MGASLTFEEKLNPVNGSANIERYILRIAKTKKVMNSATVTGAPISGITIRDVLFHCVKFSRCMLSQVNFEECVFDGCFFSDSVLVESRFLSCSFTNTTIEMSVLRNTDIIGNNTIRGLCLGDGMSFHGNKMRYAQVSFSGHGYCGRMLTILRSNTFKRSNGQVPTLVFCGGFNGTTRKLRRFISNGASELAPSRTMALDTAIRLLRYERHMRTVRPQAAELPL